MEQKKRVDLIVSPYFYGRHGIHFRIVELVFIQLLFGLVSHKNSWLVSAELVGRTENRPGENPLNAGALP